MKYADISGLSEKEMTKKSLEARTGMFEAKMKNALGQLANPMEIREARRNIARLKTAATVKKGQAPQRKLTRETRLLLAAKSKAKAAVKGTK